MIPILVAYRFKVDSVANWTNNNPVLKEGEVGYERETKRMKVGDGATVWNKLPYAFESVATIEHTGSYELKPSDASSRQKVTGAASITIKDKTIPVGSVVEFVQASAGTGLVKLVTAGAMVLNTPSSLETRARWSTIVVYFEQENEATVGGDLK